MGGTGSDRSHYGWRTRLSLLGRPHYRAIQCGRGSVQTQKEQYPARVEQLVASGDYRGAHALMDKIGEFRSQEPQVVRLSPT